MKVLKKKRGFDAAAEVAKQFRALRMSKPDRPVMPDGDPLEPRVPHDLTLLTDVALGRLHSEFACMQQYAQACLGWIEAQKILDRRAARLTRAEGKVSYSGKATLMEAVVDLEPKTRAKEDQSIVSDAVATITTAMMRSMEIGKDACSREMTRRIAMREQNTPSR